MTRPAVTVLSLGGTIASLPAGDGGLTPQLGADALVRAVPALAHLAEIEAQSFRQTASAHLTMDDLEALADKIRQAVSAGTRGVVITQGTDTIEETAFVLDRLLDSVTPVVVTGAMRNPSLPGADGPANMLAATRVALSVEARGQGVLVVMNDTVHAARFVRKGNTSTPDAFVSPIAGPMGWLVEDRVRVPVRLPPLPSLPRPRRGSKPVGKVTVPLVTIGLDEDPLVVEVLAEFASGLVIAAPGGGHVSPALADVLGAAAARIPVVLASRTGAGEVLAKSYGYAGGDIDLQRRGLIRAGWLDGVKARLLLMILLRRGVRAADDVSASFQPFGGGLVD